MAIKKLYTENYIREIADSIRGLIDDERPAWTTQEMSAIISSVHRGPREVWIGSQISYNQLSEDEIDPEICYIILEDGKIFRAYAGSVMIYDDPIVWHYTISGKYMSDGATVDTGLVMDTSKSFEYILHVSSMNPDPMDIEGYFDVANSFAVSARYLSNDKRFFFRNTRGHQPGYSLCTEEVDHRNFHLYYRVKYVVGSAIEVYWIDYDTNDETFIGTIENGDRDVSATFSISWTGLNNYTIQDFKFRWLAEE